MGDRIKDLCVYYRETKKQREIEKDRQTDRDVEIMKEKCL